MKQALQARREGKRPTTQAGPFVREEMRQFKRGSRNVRSRRQAIAIGLSEARRAGVHLGPPRTGGASAGTGPKTRRKTEIGAGRAGDAAPRSRRTGKGARTRGMKPAAR